MTAPSRWLKRGLHRAVELRPLPDGAAVVVKHFRSRGLLRRLGDRRRALRERRLLEELEAAGASVPRPVDLGYEQGSWRLTMTAVERATSLADLLRRTTGLSPRVARSLGRAIGRAHALGLRHGDLHGGNMLVDGSGRAWIIDLASARRTSGAEEALLREDLVSLLADSLERCSRTEILAFAAAWLAEQPEARRAAWAEPGHLDGLVAEARVHRRRSLRRHADRWTRPSGLCDEHSVAAGSLLVARDAPPGLDEPGSLLALLEHTDEDALPPGLVVDSGPGTVGRWTRLGLARQHGLPALQPVALLRGGVGERALLHAPPGSRPMAASEEARPLQAELAERGYAAETDALWHTPEGQVLLGPGCSLMEDAARG